MVDTVYAQIDAHEQAEEDARRADLQHREWMERGYAALGYMQVTRKDASGLHTEYVWALRQAENVAGLPAAIVERAREAVAAERAAREAFEAKDREARDYIAKHGLSSQAAQVHLELYRAETWTAFQATQRPTRHALRDLGQLVDQAQQIRATINAAPRKRAQIETQYQTQLAQLDAEVQAAQLRAMQLGLS